MFLPFYKIARIEIVPVKLIQGRRRNLHLHKTLKKQVH